MERGPAALPGAFGRLLAALAAAQAAPLALALAESDAAAVRGFALGAGCALFFGGVLVLAGRGGGGRLDRRGAILFAAGGWALAGVFAAPPFLLSGAVDGVSGALVEAVSGVTATGLGVVEAPGAAPRAIVLWRAMLQWLGGYATLVFVVVLAPRIARSGPAPPARRVAARAAAIYLPATAAAAAALVLAGAPLLEASCYAMSAVSTGGFAPDDAGPAALGRAAQAVLMLAMIAGALDLPALWRRGAARSGGGAGRAEAVPFAALAVAGAGGLALALGGGEAAWRGAFAAVSALTTAGFTAGLESPAPAFVLLALAGLAFVGGAGASTAGGVKLFRARLLLARSRRELERLAHPHRAGPARAPADEAAAGAVGAFFALFIGALVVLTLALAAAGQGFEAASILALSALTNTGPLLAEAAGAGAAALGGAGDIALVLGMLAGRLEILAFFVALALLVRRR